MNPSPHPSAGAEAAPRDDGPRQYLRLAVGSSTYAAPIDAVREILEVGRLTAVPQTPDFVRGVMNLRGAVVPVIDLAARCGGPRTVVGRRSAVVIVDVAAGGESGQMHTVGMLVDAVFEVFDVGAEGLEATPVLGTAISAEYLRGMARLRGQFLGVLDLERLLNPAALAELISPAAVH